MCSDDMMGRLAWGSGAKRAGSRSRAMGGERREGRRGIYLDQAQTWDRVSVRHAVEGPTMGMGVIVTSRVVGEFQWGCGRVS